MPFVSRTRATFRSAEFGFFGVWVNTRTQTPRFCGLSCSAGLLVLLTIFLRPARTSWLMVGIVWSFHVRGRIPRPTSTANENGDEATPCRGVTPSRVLTPEVAPGLEALRL